MLIFRDATAEDAPLISRIFAASWRSTYQGVIAADYLRRLPDDYWVQPVRAWLDGGHYGLIALVDEQAIGCIIFGRGRDATHEGWGEILSFYVLPQSMRRGVGSALLQEALTLLRADGYARVYLWAIEGNAIADSFYRRHGFIATGERVPYRIGSTDVADLRYVLK